MKKKKGSKQDLVEAAHPILPDINKRILVINKNEEKNQTCEKSCSLHSYIEAF